MKPIENGSVAHNRPSNQPDKEIDKSSEINSKSKNNGNPKKNVKDIVAKAEMLKETPAHATQRPFAKSKPVGNSQEFIETERFQPEENGTFLDDKHEDSEAIAANNNEIIEKSVDIFQKEQTYQDTSSLNSLEDTSSNSSISSPPSTYSTADEEGAQFVLARLHDRSLESRHHIPGSTSIEASTTSLNTSFNVIKNSLTPNEENTCADWDFWAKVVSNYEGLAKKHPRMMNKKLRQGIPDPIRGMVWQLLCRSKDRQLEKVYRNLLLRSSTHEKLILRDLNRTFPKHEFFQQPENQQSLFNITKAYSLYDAEVGYCQGIAFIVGPLMLNMPEEEAFCVLVKLMKAYNFRDLYTPQMKGLQLRLYQFDQILKEMLPQVHKHLGKEGIRSSMFMTLFAYRFPLSIVFRILDIVMGGGFDSVFRFAFALLKKNQETILKLEFESVIDFLKNGLFDIYLEHDQVDQLMIDESDVSITKTRLDKLAQDWKQAEEKQDPESLDIRALRIQYRHLADQMKRMDKAYELLSLEHIQLANELLDEQGRTYQLNEKLEVLGEQVDSLRNVISIDRNNAEEKVKEEMEMLANKNVQLISRNSELEDTIIELEEMLIKVRMQYAQSETERENVYLELEELKKKTNKP